MPETELTTYRFTLEKAMLEWLYQKRVTKSDSNKTNTAYRETFQSFQNTLQLANLDILSNPIDITRIATIWASQRSNNAKKQSNVSDATYNQRLAIISSFYTFLQKTYKLDIVNPIKDVPKRSVQAYAYAMPLDSEEVNSKLQSIDQSTLHGKRDYALLCLGLMTGRRASELVGLRWKHVKQIGKRLILEFHCKGGKIKRNALDEDLSRLLLNYLRAAYSDLSKLDPEAPIWISLSRRNQGQPIGVHTLSDLCEQYLGTTRIHTLRHTFAKEMEKAGATLTEIQDSLGHEELETTARYMKELGSEENKHAFKLARRFGIATLPSSEAQETP